MTARRLLQGVRWTAAVLLLVLGRYTVAQEQADDSVAPHAKDYEQWTRSLQGKSTNELVWDKQWQSLLARSIPRRARSYYLNGLGGPPEEVKIVDLRYVVLAACQAHDCGHMAMFWYDAKTDVGIGAETGGGIGIAGYSLKARGNALPEAFHKALLDWVAREGIECLSETTFQGADGK